MFRDAYTKWTTLFFFAMAVFAIVFAKERFQADGAHYLLHVVQSEDFRIEHQRYILVFSQALAWIGVQFGAPLNLVFILNSLNAVLWFYVLFQYAVHYLKDRHAGIAIILTSVLGVLHIQFVPMYEIYYGIPLVILVYAHLRNNKVSTVAEMILFLGILVTALFAHPLLPIPLVFAFIYHAIETRKLNWKMLIPVALVFAGWYIAKKLMLTEYEAGKVSLLSAEWNTSPDHLLQPAYYRGLAKFFLTWYTVPVLLLTWTIVFFLLRKMRWQLFTTIAFFAGHILIVNYTHDNYPELTPYFERMYLPLIPIVLIPFLFTLCRELQFSHSFIMITLLLVVAWRIGRFTDVGMDYKQRTEQTTQLIHFAQQQKGSKFQMDVNDSFTCFKWADWSFPMETLLRSTAENPLRRITIVTDEDLRENGNREKLDDDEFLFRRWEIMKDRDLNPRYFTLMPGKYVVLAPFCK
ncbi:MAG TPA: hypothetical protein VK826_12600 [Bacteroidia bacterium]|nr:hypothetical protein [Bacteroidia bacterium]